MSTATSETIWDKSRLANPHAQPDKARRVQAMFDAIAPTYERVNRLLSAGRDAYWRREAVRMANIIPADRVLDLACGTGDFTRAFAKAGPALVVGSDFSAGMLRLAASRDTAGARWCQSDAHHLPFDDQSFTIVSCAFGARNFQDLPGALCEIQRVLRPGGRAVILEFWMPRSGVLAGLYRFYFRRVLPRMAAMISRDRSGAYNYLPRSVETFIDEARMKQRFEAAGLHLSAQRSFSFGIVTVMIARKSGKQALQ
ncbi:MAG TPA: bifunctional demethylmenaquinone methyltransferase/2-methoxy-6-polyprenyl-1,4-benzoquinol methylase UbiE [Phycisphaerae bacterium]|nr:bifunctional demethylmenaquinone methyltransferase/2-methoxy-6-polyprenyl-1,4-benzoquinol methylase UbiE [Phycisphaerae bacterium]